jgi:hypothetical protein
MAVGEPLDRGPTGPAAVAVEELVDCGPRTVGDPVDTGPAAVVGAVDSGSTETCPHDTVEPLINAVAATATIQVPVPRLMPSICFLTKQLKVRFGCPVPQ